jgi:hypothetical protein
MKKIAQPFLFAVLFSPLFLNAQNDSAKAARKPVFTANIAHQTLVHFLVAQRCQLSAIN